MLIDGPSINEERAESKLRDSRIIDFVEHIVMVIGGSRDVEEFDHVWRIPHCSGTLVLFGSACLSGIAPNDVHNTTHRISCDAQLFPPSYPRVGYSGSKTEIKAGYVRIPCEIICSLACVN